MIELVLMIEYSFTKDQISPSCPFIGSFRVVSHSELGLVLFEHLALVLHALF